MKSKSKLSVCVHSCTAVQEDIMGRKELMKMIMSCSCIAFYRSF